MQTGNNEVSVNGSLPLDYARHPCITQGFLILSNLFLKLESILDLEDKGNDVMIGPPPWEVVKFIMGRNKVSLGKYCIARQWTSVLPFLKQENALWNSRWCSRSNHLQETLPNSLTNDISSCCCCCCCWFFFVFLFFLQMNVTHLMNFMKSSHRHWSCLLALN